MDSTNNSDKLKSLVKKYAKALDIIDQFDQDKLYFAKTENKESFQIDYTEAAKVIHALREEIPVSDMFGQEKDDTFKSSLKSIYQTFDSNDLYPTLEEKAANLLYFIVKNHSFSDGNKRIGAFIFIWFLEKNNFLYKKDGTERISPNELTVMTLLIAQSKKEDKEKIVKVVLNLLAE